MTTEIHIAAPHERDEATEPVPEREREIVFRVDDLKVSYSGNLAVHDVNLEIFRSEITAFIGPSGAASRRCCAASTG